MHRESYGRAMTSVYTVERDQISVYFHGALIQPLIGPNTSNIFPMQHETDGLDLWLAVKAPEDRKGGEAHMSICHVLFFG